jgi:hypothetical protein
MIMTYTKIMFRIPMAVGLGAVGGVGISYGIKTLYDVVSLRYQMYPHRRLIMQEMDKLIHEFDSPELNFPDVFDAKRQQIYDRIEQTYDAVNEHVMQIEQVFENTTNTTKSMFLNELNELRSTKTTLHNMKESMFMCQDEDTYQIVVNFSDQYVGIVPPYEKYFNTKTNVSVNEPYLINTIDSVMYAAKIAMCDCFGVMWQFDTKTLNTFTHLLPTNKQYFNSDTGSWQEYEYKMIGVEYEFFKQFKSTLKNATYTLVSSQNMQNVSCHLVSVNLSEMSDTVMNFFDSYQPKTAKDAANHQRMKQHFVETKCVNLVMKGYEPVM